MARRVLRRRFPRPLHSPRHHLNLALPLDPISTCTGHQRPGAFSRDVVAHPERHGRVW